MKKIAGVMFLVLFCFTLVAADFSIDVSVDKDSYSIGEEIVYTVRLVDGGDAVGGEIDIVFSDNLGKKIIERTVSANEEQTLLVGEDFPSGGWEAVVSYEGIEGKGIFLVTVNREVSFVIDGDRLMLRMLEMLGLQI